MLMMLLMYNHCQNSICYKKILGYCVTISLGTRIFFSIMLVLSLVDYSLITLYQMQSHFWKSRF